MVILRHHVASRCGKLGGTVLFLEMRGALLLIENLCTNYLVLSLSRWSVSMPQQYLPFFFFFAP